ncbi:MAG: PorV/PorQ family protein [Proteobacteria bacterium]|nr:PorV/PorQ family protein [Pseudomonadota bacterium]
MALLCALPRAARASGSPGTTTLDFLKIGLAPRPAGMGETFVGVADSVDTLSYNPAGLAFLDRQELSMMHHLYVLGVHQEYGAYAYPTDDLGTFSVGVNILRVQAFNSYDVNDQPTGKVSAQDNAFTGAYAYAFNDIAVGFAGKYITSRLDDASVQTAAFDGGVLWKAHPRIRVGASVLNIGPDVKYLQEAAPIPLTFKSGFSFQIPVNTSRLILAADGTFPRDRAAYVNGGAEFEFNNLFTVRAGYKGNQDASNGLTLGFGIHLIHRSFGYYAYAEYPRWLTDLQLDYAYVGMGDLGQTHRIGLSMKFGTPARYDFKKEEQPIYYGTR